MPDQQFLTVSGVYAFALLQEKKRMIEDFSRENINMRMCVVCAFLKYSIRMKTWNVKCDTKTDRERAEDSHPEHQR